MKELKKLKISQLSTAELKEREMNMLLGGNDYGDCSCGCTYASETSGSSKSTNEKTNIDGGKVTPGYGKCDSIFGYFTVNWYGN